MGERIAGHSAECMNAMYRGPRVCICGADPTPTPEQPEQEIGCPHGAWGMIVPCPHCGTPRTVTPSQFVSNRFLREVEAGEREWPQARPEQDEAVRLREALERHAEAHADFADEHCSEACADEIAALATPPPAEQDEAVRLLRDAQPNGMTIPPAEWQRRRSEVIGHYDDGKNTPALATPPPVPAALPLDVERLARAYDLVWQRQTNFRRDPHFWRKVAAEYARLSPDQEDGDD